MPKILFNEILRKILNIGKIKKENFFLFFSKNSKNCEYNKTALNFDNSQNKLSDINSNSKCNNSESLKDPLYSSAFRNCNSSHLNISDQSKEELESLIKGNCNQTR